MQPTREEEEETGIPEFRSWHPRKEEPNAPDTVFKILSGPLRDSYIYSTMNLSIVILVKTFLILFLAITQ